MIKGIITSLRKNKILISLFALSFCLLSSYSASALGSWSSTESSYLNFSHNTYGGCLWKGYELADDGTNLNSVFLGTNKVGSTTSSSDLYNCGYRYLNSHMNYYQHSNGITRSYIVTDGVVTTDTYSTVGGSTNVITNNNSGFANYDFDIYNQVEDLTFMLDSSNNTPYTIPALDESIDWGYAFYIFSFDVPNAAAYSGLQFGIPSDSLSVSTGSPFSTSTARQYMNDSIITWCGNLNSYARGFPDYLMDLELTTTENHYKCYVGGSIPMSNSTANAIKWYNNNTIKLVAKDASMYSKVRYKTSNGVVLPYYGYPWHGIFRSPSYKQMNARYDSSLKITNPRFDIVWCVTSEECAEFEDKNYALMTDTESSEGTANTGGNYSSTIQEEIDYNEQQAANAQSSLAGLNINFSVPWVLQGWFNLFIDNDCVNIPNIQGLIHSTESRICSPWVNTPVRTILTPIITVVASMLLFGFFVRWLKHGSKGEIMYG